MHPSAPKGLGDRGDASHYRVRLPIPPKFNAGTREKSVLPRHEHHKETLR
jgi:hypothetical protein